MKVLFDYKEEDRPGQLISGPVMNKDLIQKYLDSMEHYRCTDNEIGYWYPPIFGIEQAYRYLSNVNH